MEKRYTLRTRLIPKSTKDYDEKPWNQLIDGLKEEFENIDKDKHRIQVLNVADFGDEDVLELFILTEKEDRDFKTIFSKLDKIANTLESISESLKTIASKK